MYILGKVPYIAISRVRGSLSSSDGETGTTADLVSIIGDSCGLGLMGERISSGMLRSLPSSRASHDYPNMALRILTIKMKLPTTL